MDAIEPAWYGVGGGELRDTIDHPRATPPAVNGASDPAQAKTPKTRQLRRRTSPVVRALRAGLYALGFARTKPRPFYRRWWFRAPAVLAVLLIFGAANNFGDPSTTPSFAGQRSDAALGGAAVAQAAPASTPTLPTDQGWVLDSYRLQDRAFGDFGGTVRITNTNKAAQSAVFTIFVMAKGHVVASLQGSADNAGAGKTVTVQLTSQDKYRLGSHTIDFQTAVTHY